MSDKEEILKKHGLQIAFKSTYSWDAILLAMDEYAASFKKEIFNAGVSFERNAWRYSVEENDRRLKEYFKDKE